jgi:hypothetical protein
LLVLGLGAAGAIWLSMGDRQGLEQVKQGVQGVKDGLSAANRPAEAPARGRTDPPVTTPPPPTVPTQPNPAAVAGTTEVPVAPARTGTTAVANTAGAAAADPPDPKERPGETGVAGKRALPPRTKGGIGAAANAREDRIEPRTRNAPVTPKTNRPVKPTATTRRTVTPAPQLDIPLPPKKPEEPPRSRFNPGTSPILD